MNKEIIKIGIIGACGIRMGYSHLKNLNINKKVHLRAFCDLNIEGMKEIIQKNDYRVDYITDNVEQVMQDCEVDLIVAGLPHEIHKDMILKAAKYKKSIFIEKPMVMSPDECYEVLDAVKESGINVLVGHNRRFSPIYNDAKKIYKEKMEHKPAVISCRVADPLPYLVQEKPEGGRIYGEGCHFFDLLSWFLEKEPVKIYTEGDFNNFHITIRFEDGSIGLLTSSAEGGAGYSKELFECFADNQSIIIEDVLCLTHSSNCGVVTVTNYPLSNDIYPYLPYNIEGYRQRMSNYARDYCKNGGDSIVFAVHPRPEGDKGHYQELDECINAILNNRRFSSNEVDGARAIICCEAAVQSVKTGMPVKINVEQYKR